MTNLTIYVNTGVADVSYDTSAALFTEVSLGNDYLICSAGSDVVIDGAAIPSAADLNRAASVITTSNVDVAHYFLADISASIIREIHNAGNQNKRYVFCFAFDGATESEPVLEIWDDDGLDSIALLSLGDGVATDSWWKGVTTTSSSPGVSWIGSALAGSSNSHFLWLNDNLGALSAAGELYCNLKIVIPANFTSAGAETPVIAIKYTTN